MDASSHESVIAQAEAIVAHEGLLVLEEEALGYLRDVPGLSFTAICPDASSLFVVALDGRPIGRVYRVRVEPLGLPGWVGVPYRPARSDGLTYPTPAEAARAVRDRSMDGSATTGPRP